jgi:CDP-diacylglycerol--glycerol-3-phosphate 3-phosphatidyltransferase/cardiolipin synthase
VSGRTRANGRLGTIIVSGVIAARIIAAPLLLYTFTRGRRWLALGIFLCAVLTDALDGYVGRRLGGRPVLGPYSDAAADFLLVLAAFSAFALKSIYPPWTIFLIVAMFVQFVLTSRLKRPLYDPVGKYYGVFLFAAVGLTLALPHPVVNTGVLVGIVGFTAASIASRSAFLLGLWKERP